MHGVSFPYCMHVRIGFGRRCLSAFTPLSIQGLVLVWGWERARPSAGRACFGPLYSSFFFDFTQQLSIDRYVLFSDAMVPSYKRGPEDIFALFCSLILNLGFGSRYLLIPLFLRGRVEVRSFSCFYLFEREVSTLGGVNDCARGMHFFVLLIDWSVAHDLMMRFHDMRKWGTMIPGFVYGLDWTGLDWMDEM
jgi:hypothetical protein